MYTCFLTRPDKVAVFLMKLQVLASSITRNGRREHIKIGETSDKRPRETVEFVKEGSVCHARSEDDGKETEDAEYAVFEYESLGILKDMSQLRPHCESHMNFRGRLWMLENHCRRYLEDGKVISIN